MDQCRNGCVCRCMAEQHFVRCYELSIQGSKPGKDGCPASICNSTSVWLMVKDKSEGIA